jgi:rhodanese-related sulfurtransferase
MRGLLVVLLCAVVWLPVQAREAPLVVDGAVTINVLQAKYLYDRGALFIDVRPSREWGWGHVRGAVHLDLANRFAALAMTHWPRHMPLVIYCDSEVCLRSALASHLAVSWGYERVFYFRGGYFAWQLFDFPLGKGQERETVVISGEGH